MGFVYIAVTLGLGALLYWGPFALPLLDALTYSDYLYLLFLLIHLICALVLISTAPRARRLGVITSGMYRIPEVLFATSLLLYLFAYIYALNANMDYIQRFISSNGAVRLALDTQAERLAASVKYGPLLLTNAFFYVFWRLKTRRLGANVAEVTGSALSRWALPLVLLSTVLSVLCFPSFLNLEGLGFLAFAALVPLLLVFQANALGWAVFYGLTFGVLQAMLLNSWLGTYSLVTLQLVCFAFLIFYLVFLIPTLWLYKSLPRIGFLILPLAWVGFEFLRSSGFFGYPWGLWGVTQYQFTSLVQIAALTGIWGLSFIVLLINSGFAVALGGVLGIRSAGHLPAQGSGRVADRRAPAVDHGLSALLICSFVFLLFLGVGTIGLGRAERQTVIKRPRLALVQQNADPRKHNYRQTFDTLVALTDQAVQRNPDLIVWSETAFVPNISRWSRVDPKSSTYAALVRDFLDYQDGLDRWLLTGNDDYELIANDQGQRLDYNAAILFDPEGNRVRTYRKIRLVPFTEYFPWKERLPGVYNWLEQRDVYLWEPGQERVVFSHPLFRFSTPICFEDAFPGDVRLFVREGAEVIVNISNDYWSLTEVEGKQHGVNSYFRAVENRVPLVRASASGLTGYVDTVGRLVATVPFYQERYLVADVEIHEPVLTLYTRFGDWFPKLLLGVFVVFLLFSAFPALRRAL